MYTITLRSYRAQAPAIGHRARHVGSTRFAALHLANTDAPYTLPCLGRGGLTLGVHDSFSELAYPEVYISSSENALRAEWTLLSAVIDATVDTLHSVFSAGVLHLPERDT